jgi:hypothetical protein
MRGFLCCAFCVVLLIAGCGGSADEEAIEKKIEKATGGEAEVDISKKGMEVKGETEEGEYKLEAGEETEIPEDFPGDVFIYRPSKTVMAMKVPQGHSVTLTTGHDQSTVIETYKQEMTASGWSEEGYVDMGDRVMLVYKKNGRGANISIAPADDGLTINVIVGAD